MRPRLPGIVLSGFLLALGAAWSPARGQDLRGRVVDENGRPVPFAQVEVLGTDRRVVSDVAGVFIISALRDGDYDVRVRRIGYEPVITGVRLPLPSGPVTITIRSLPQVLDSVRIRERGPSPLYTGIVLDDLDEPVVGAEVIAAGASDLGVRTDSSGHFRLLKAQKGTLLLRIRKFGYTPYFGSLRLMAEREDTLRVKRLAQDLPQAYVLAESGFGRDTFAYAELDARMRWNHSTSAIASREDLSQWDDLDLCRALMRTAAAGKMQLRESECSLVRCVIIDGERPLLRPLTAFLAAEVEAFEYHWRDQTGTINSRTGLMCNRSARDPSKLGGGVVIWMRKEKP